MVTREMLVMVWVLGMVMKTLGHDGIWQPIPRYDNCNAMSSTWIVMTNTFRTCHVSSLTANDVLYDTLER